MHSSCFVEAEQILTLLHDLAARVATASDQHQYGDNAVVWFEEGNKVLDYVETDERLNADSFKDSMEEQGVVINKHDLTTLIDNMRNLVVDHPLRFWKTLLDRHEHGRHDSCICGCLRHGSDDNGHCGHLLCHKQAVVRQAVRRVALISNTSIF